MALKYKRAISIFSQRPAGRWIDLMPYAGFSLGNVETSARVGGLARVGVNLPDDFGPQTVGSLSTPDGGRSHAANHGRWSIYGFGSLEGEAVGYTAFLDGNLWQSSHHVPHDVLVGEFSLGGVLSSPRMEVGFSLVHRSRDFRGQTAYNRYGSAYLKIFF